MSPLTEWVCPLTGSSQGWSNHAGPNHQTAGPFASSDQCHWVRLLLALQLSFCGMTLARSLEFWSRHPWRFLRRCFGTPSLARSAGQLYFHSFLCSLRGKLAHGLRARISRCLALWALIARSKVWRQFQGPLFAGMARQKLAYGKV